MIHRDAPSNYKLGATKFSGNPKIHLPKKRDPLRNMASYRNSTQWYPATWVAFKINSATRPLGCDRVGLQAKQESTSTKDVYTSLQILGQPSMFFVNRKYQMWATETEILTLNVCKQHVNMLYTFSQCRWPVYRNTTDWQSLIFGGFPEIGVPQIIHFNGMFWSKPSSYWDTPWYPHLWNPPWYRSCLRFSSWRSTPRTSSATLPCWVFPPRKISGTPTFSPRWWCSIRPETCHSWWSPVCEPRLENDFP